MHRNNDKRLLVKGETCLITCPEIAVTLGRSEAIFLQQLHYWLTNDSDIGHVFNGQKWIYNSYKSWAKNIRVFSESTIRRAVSKLEKMGIILTKNMNKKKSDHTKWYTINYQKLKEIIPALLNFKQEQTKRCPESSIRLTKMSSPCVQTEQIVYKETEITLENKTISSEGVAFRKQKECSQQVNFVKKESELKTKNNLAAELLGIWNQTVGQGGTLAHLTKKRAQHLVAAFKYRFGSSLEKWKQFCQQITTSDFLMGKVKETFKASLDWVLKFDIIQRILEGDFGIKPREAVHHSGLEEKSLETLSEEIDLSDETAGVKNLRLKLLHQFGKTLYQSWFKGLTIIIEGQGRGVRFQAASRFAKDYIETHYLKDLCSLTSKDIHILC